MSHHMQTQSPANKMSAYLNKYCGRLLAITMTGNSKKCPSSN